MNRPTCGTCPHNVRGACYLSPAEWQDQGCGPPVADDRPGCQHHPDMGAWLAGRKSAAHDQYAAAVLSRCGGRE